MHSSSYFFAYLLGACPRASDIVASSRSAFSYFQAATAHVEEVRRTSERTCCFCVTKEEKNLQEMVKEYGVTESEFLRRQIRQRTSDYPEIKILMGYLINKEDM